MNSASGLAAVFHDPAVLDHDVSPGHPEGPDRVEAVVNAINQAFGTESFRRPGRLAQRDLFEAIERVHDREYVARFRSACERFGRGYLDTPDCPFSPKSFDAALAAVSAGLSAVADVDEGRLRRAFVAARPPGHHARERSAMGFCFFNTVAVMASELQSRGYERILILDWDVHHGNGTQEIFWENDRVFYASIHRWPFYPGSGSSEEIGEQGGRGFTANFPLPGGSDDSVYQEVFDGPLADAVSRFHPEFILVSAGFDSHERDPLGGMNVSDEGFGLWTQRVVQWANAFARGRVVSLLEGGYDREALGRASVRHFAGLLGRDRNYSAIELRD